MLHVTEVLRHGQARQRDAHADSRRLIHLAEDERGVLQHAHLLHLEEEVRALTGALTDAGEDRRTGELTRDTGDHLLNQNGLADAGATEQADLAALDVRGQQVDDLDARLQDLGLAFELVEGRRLAVDAPLLAVAAETRLIQAIAQGVEDVALDDVADGNRNRLARVGDVRAADEAVGRGHGDGAHQVVAQVLRRLEDDGLGDRRKGNFHGQRVVQCRELGTRELHVDDGTDDTHDAADGRRGVLLIESCAHI